jgi:transposase
MFMEAKKLCCGIDVSHTTLDVCYQNNLGELFHLKVGNNNQGFGKYWSIPVAVTTL